MAPHSLEDTQFDGPALSSSPLQPGQFIDSRQHQSPATNGNGTSQTSSHTSHLRSAAPEQVLDLVAVGFGPASLSVAVALDDSISGSKLETPPKVAFLEKQPRFAWHAGMLLPGAKMQISFMKDMATLRDPRSKYTFINYLHQKGRLVEFMNLSTFLPARTEYEDYLRWCAGHFDDVVHYNNEVVSISPVATPVEGQSVSAFTVTSRDVKTGATNSFRAKNVLVAVGGQPSIPKSFPQNHPRVIHSSQYAHLVPKILTRRDAPYRVAVIGAGQSAAEIFNNVQTLYPNSKTSLIMRSEFLKPSDDSPFVNSIFNPSYVDSLFPRSAASRHSTLADARATNYGVVRLELIEHLYEVMYDQHRALGPDERAWPHRIMGATDIAGIEEVAAPASNGEGGDGYSSPQFRISVKPVGDASKGEVLDVDLVIAATGYQRNSHLQMMSEVEGLLPEAVSESEVISKLGSKYDARIGGRPVRVARDYSLQFAPGKVASGSGIWLQGCCEGTHGLSDTLLSILATRGGEIVDSIFGTPAAAATQ